MKFYAHTAEDDQGNRLPDEEKWQPLSEHLRNVGRPNEPAGVFDPQPAFAWQAIISTSMFQSAPFSGVQRQQTRIQRKKQQNRH